MQFLPDLPSSLGAKFTATLIIVGLAGLILLVSAYASLFRPLSAAAKDTSSVAAEEDITLNIAAGSSFNEVSTQLTSLGLLQQALPFKLWARYRGLENEIQVGEFRLSKDHSPAEILDILTSGLAVQYKVTLLEGWTFAQALDAIWQSEKVSIQLQGKSLQEIAALMNLEVSNPEGMLFPDTYFYTADTSDLELLLRAQKQLQTILTVAWEDRLGALPLASAYESLILASIIEKESGLFSEREAIAGVFIRRLEQGMRLQSDPTVIYGMGARYQGNITRADLRETTAYNTYRVNGLPPTPIALAGADSVRASVNPEAGDSLYFVAKGDGSHHFSSNLEEHNAAVRRYQLN